MMKTSLNLHKLPPVSPLPSIAPPFHYWDAFLMLGHDTSIMLSPPETSYCSVDVMLQRVKEFGHSQGYAIRIGRSDDSRNRIVLVCDRGATYHRANSTDSDPSNMNKQSRCSGTRLINCPFQLYGKLLKSDGCWHLFIRNGENNHGPSMDIAGHPSARRLQPDQRTITEQMLTSEIAPKNIPATLRHVNPQTREKNWKKYLQ
ncbi:hypothetical protein PsorP6_001626 [Peronosclerospora sorghi]|uniref:Uncharacterized protein n=1 Tax=Peronosclerospora sorghi TaxID=230839 RepID=A0ACC0WST0_9STRA|nr:hypothetical protein PsorP6_001626 [Peronosclerospora sorghi]